MNSTTQQPLAALDTLTRDFLQELESGSTAPDAAATERIRPLLAAAQAAERTRPLVEFFKELRKVRREQGLAPQALGLDRETLVALCLKHRDLDEHAVTIGGRAGRAEDIVYAAGERVREYLAVKDAIAPSGIELWPRIQENQARIKAVLGMQDADWDSFSGQLRYAINDVDTLARCIDLPAKAIADVARVTRDYRMRLTPYYASLIMPGQLDDPVLLQAVPTAEMVDTVGEEIPPVASDHSPARLIDQFYPRVVTIKATNICAMYCVHCLRIAHIGKQDRNFGWEAFEEALEYIREHDEIRDVLITGGDAFMLSNAMLRKLLGELDTIPHVRMKRLGTRVPVTTPQRVDQELLDILAESDDRGPVRVVTQINTAQEITPVSRDTFKRISRSVSAVLNQAVFLRGINDERFKMWKLCETVQEAYVRPYYLFNCSYRNPQYYHLRVPTEIGRDIIESMYGNLSGDAIPRFIAPIGGKVPLHRDNVVAREGNTLILRKPWNGDVVRYPDQDPEVYADNSTFAFKKYAD